jgi:ubiquinone/menaquinone biosynthesis C-methylase UbiE
MTTKQYNKFAREYEKLTEEMEEETRDNYYSLISVNLRDKKLLDVGCGDGGDFIYYSKKGAKIFGLDISKEQIRLAKEKTSGKFIVGNMEEIPYPDNFFDVVTSKYALQSSKDVRKALEEMVRVAKKGAEILILTKHPFRNFLEGHINNGKKNYFQQSKVDSYIFNRKIKLTEPSHTMEEYISPFLLEKASLEKLEEHSDFPASEQVIKGLTYPTYMILKYKKK